MGHYFTITLLVQSISSTVIGLIMFYFSRTYKQAYLRHWAWSFIMLALFLVGAFSSSYISTLGFAFDAPLRLANVFFFSLAGFLQVAFLIMGTFILLKDHHLHHKQLFVMLAVMLFLSAFVTFFQAWNPEASNLRYLTRIGSRYLLAGVAFVGAAYLILKNNKNNSMGQKFVLASFVIYGTEMLTLGIFTLEYYIKGESAFLFSFVQYHGLFELMIYPMIAIGLVMWLLDVERERSLAATNVLYNLNKTDGLTGLPNRQALEQAFKSWDANSTDPKSKTLILLGVDKLQRINDAEGIKMVDRLLIRLSRKLENTFNFAIFFGRLHGDTFVAVVQGNKRKVSKWMERHWEDLVRPFKIDNKLLQIKLSAGLVELDNDLSLDDALYQSNIAMQVAKEKGGNCSVIYDTSLKLDKSPDLLLEEEIRSGYKNNQFVLYYQPIWSISSNRIVSFEALIRWDHPQRGILPPGAFLHGVMQMGQQRMLDIWVLKTVIKQLYDWKQSGLSTLNVAINISPETLETNEIVQSIIHLTNKYQLDPSMLTIEVTENVAMKSIESGRNVLGEIERLGVMIAIDDFGTGYSSLNYLKTFPSDVVKFDRSFITQLQKNDANHEILKSLVPLCKRLGKRVVLEGIEDKLQVDIVSDLDIDGFQGYYFSYPVNVKQAASMMKSKQIARAI